MSRKLWVAASAALLLTAPACGRKPAERAETQAAQALLTAAWSDDETAFEAVVDRPALRQDLRQQLQQVAQANMLAVEGGASDAALDRMITPHAFRLVDAAGAPLSSAPTRDQISPLIKRAGSDRVCIHDATPEQACLLTFAKEKTGAKGETAAKGKAWRLVAMASPGFTVTVGQEPASGS